MSLSSEDTILSIVGNTQLDLLKVIPETIDCVDFNDCSIVASQISDLPPRVKMVRLFNVDIQGAPNLSKLQEVILEGVTGDTMLITWTFPDVTVESLTPDSATGSNP